MTHRSEPPTARRLREARRRGEVATSRDLTAAGALAGAVVALAATAGASVRVLAGGLRSGIHRALDPAATAGPAIADALRSLLRAGCAPMTGALLGACLVGSLQARGLFSIEAVGFRWDRIAPGGSGRGPLSPARLGAVGLAILRAAVLLPFGVLVAVERLRALRDPGRLPPATLLASLGRIVLGVASPLVLVAVGFGLADWMLALRRHRERLRMTRDEVRREQRDDQGDPARRAERRRAHRALASAPPLRRASCLVVNPTHVAVALHHDRACDDAPVVVAKGKGPAASRLRAVARRAGVPIVEDVALARALYRLAEIGDEIPEELYEPAAVVLAELYRNREVTP